MSNAKIKALHHAREFAAEAETILGVEGVQEELGKIGNGDKPSELIVTKSLESLSDIASIAAALIGLFVAIDQIRRGQIMRNASQEDMVVNLTSRILENSDLPGEIKERLILAAFKILDPKE